MSEVRTCSGTFAVGYYNTHFDSFVNTCSEAVFIFFVAQEKLSYSRKLQLTLLTVSSASSALALIRLKYHNWLTQLI